MQPNKAAEGALGSYLQMEAPGYALLVDAPWGAGKTHFVRRVCQVDSRQKEVRYVSLNGVSDEAAFRRALLQKILNETASNIATALGDLVSERLKLGNLGSLGRDIFEERLISNLPDTLVFDDIERSPLSRQILFGLINDFVEHQNKRVILIAHTELDGQNDEFLKRKEKVVGRTIRIVADFDAAFPSFLEALGSGRAKDFFEDHSDIAKSVFDQAGHNNLRLLRSAVRDCALILDRSDKELFDAKEPMARFVRTYLAFAMALAKGEISPADLDKRDNWKIAISKEVEDEFKPLNDLFRRHEGADIYAHSGATLSKTLAELLFVRGFADDSTLSRLLRMTGQFEPQDENPLWLRMLHWTRLRWDKLQELIDEGNTYLFEASPIAPGPYLHIAFCMFWIDKNGGLASSRAEIKERILNRIDMLAECGGIPAAQLGTKFGWKRRGKQFSFGGYTCDADDDFNAVIEAMHRVQLLAYEKTIANDASHLMLCFKTDLAKFVSEIIYTQDHTSFHHLQIFHLIDANDFADATLRHFKIERSEKLGDAYEKMAERHSSPKNWEEEKYWFRTLREMLMKRAAHHSKLANAQLDQFFKWHWKFAESEDNRSEISRS